MSNIIICKRCGKEMGIKQFGRHLWKIHNQKYEDYVKNNLNDFIHLGWKLCVECGEVCKSTSDRCGKCFSKTHKKQENQFIICNICNKQEHSKVFSQHLKVYHNIEFLDYVKDNLDDFKRFNWYECVICKKICKSYSKSHNQPTCSNECLSKLRETWRGEESIRFGAILSDDVKEKISAGNTGKKRPEGYINPSTRKEVREKISKTRIERGVARGENNPMYGKTHTPEAIKKIFSYRYPNNLEKIVADELDKAGIEYYYQYFIVENGICKSYDFKIKDKSIIIEVDGDFWHGNPNTTNHYEKVDRVRKNDIIKNELASKRGIRVIRLWESDIKNDSSIILKALG